MAGAPPCGSAIAVMAGTVWEGAEMAGGPLCGSATAVMAGTVWEESAALGAHLDGLLQTQRRAGLPGILREALEQWRLA